ERTFDGAHGVAVSGGRAHFLQDRADDVGAVAAGLRAPVLEAEILPELRRVAVITLEEVEGDLLVRTKSAARYAAACDELLAPARHPFVEPAGVVGGVSVLDHVKEL